MHKINTKNYNLPKWQMVRIQIKGLNQLRLLNFIRSNDIAFFDLELITNSLMYVTVHKRHTKKLYSILNMHRYQYLVTTDDFLKWAIGNVLKRIGIVIGVVCFTLVLIFSNAFVWSITIEGLDTVSQNVINNILKNNNVRSGILINSINKDELKKQILDLDNVVDVSINMEGTILRIAIFEDYFNNNTSEENAIVSNYDATVDKVIVSEGTALVAYGDKVAKGEQLISPNIYSTNGEILKTTIPKGRIYGTVVFSASEFVSPIEIVRDKTGRKKTSTYFKIFGITIGKVVTPKYTMYSTITKTGFVFGKSFLPLQYTQNVYYEQINVTVEHDAELLKEQTIKRMEELLLIKAGGNVIDIKHDIRETFGGYRIDVFVEAYMLLND